MNLLVFNMHYYLYLVLDLVFRCYWILLLKVLGTSSGAVRRMDFQLVYYI